MVCEFIARRVMLTSHFFLLNALAE